MQNSTIKALVEAAKELLIEFFGERRTSAEKDDNGNVHREDHR